MHKIPAYYITMAVYQLLQQHCIRGKPRVTKFSDLESSWQHQKHDKVYVLGTFSGEAFETLADNCR